VIPVLQGYTLDEYLSHVEQYAAAGVGLPSLPLVGLGSVCRRQGMGEAAAIVRALAVECGLRLHGFGFKTQGLVGRKHGVAPLLASADSLAWSFQGRQRWRHEGRKMCGGDHKGGCANCRPWALQWRGRLVDRIVDKCRQHQPTFL
jgi:hypothetical protein